MLKADIALSDLACSVEWTDGFIAFGTSRITPYAHPMLETLLVRTQGQWFVIVRECRGSAARGTPTACQDVQADEFGRLYRECLLWPLDYIMIEGARDGCRMKVRAGAFGSAPVYCRAFDDRVSISWDFDDLIMGSLAIDVEIASHRLALQPVYSARQLCVGVTLLTERATLYVEPGVATYRYPSAVEATRPSPLADGMTALVEFDERLRNVVTARPVRGDRIAVELSGGMDSATVACAVTRICGRIASAGVLLDGATRQPQIQRRQTIIDRLGLSDETVEIAAYPPDLDIAAHPARSVRLYWEYYLDACQPMWRSATARGCDLLFSGIGGDELAPVYTDEAQAGCDPDAARPDPIRHYAEQLMTARTLGAVRGLRIWDAPASPVPTTALLAQACRAPDLLENGLWPVNPLSDPGLVAFCHRLPRESRQDREVARQYLTTQLGADVFPRGYLKESFEQVLPDLVARHADAIVSQLHECALADLGIVDRQAVIALVRTVATTRAPEPMAPLASFLWLERLARQVS